jgi:PIN domain nuclease of toxin-antitoxin system
MSDRLLLDTCAMIWVAESDPGMAEAALEALDSAAVAGSPVFVSLITAWELGLLEARGVIPMSRPAGAAFDTFVKLPGVQLQDLTGDILANSSSLPQPVHDDPADRIIIATARALDMTIVTRDRNILSYAEAGHVRALAC